MMRQEKCFFDLNDMIYHITIEESSMNLLKFKLLLFFFFGY